MTATSTTSAPALSLKQLLDNAPIGIDPWLTPEAVAAMCAVKPGWLADAREGRKGITGPDYIKLGEGRTATIRYRLSAIKAWMASFADRASTMHRISPFADGRSWLNAKAAGKPGDRWPFTIIDGKVCELFLSMPTAVDAGRAINEIHWMTRDEYSSGRYIRKQLAMTASTLEKLKAAGNGDLAAGLEKLLR